MAVGALARFTNNYDFLHPIAQEVAEEIGLSPGTYNPFDHNLAQLVECFHVLYESQDMIRLLVDSEPGEFFTPLIKQAGEGVGAVEAPRGILYHSLQVDDSGLITKADCVIPTGQNHANIHYDLQKLVPELTARGLQENMISKTAQMLVRAYDPCISCSVH